MAGVVELIWVVGEAEYFSGKDWTTQITLIANENFVSARTVRTVQWGATAVGPGSAAQRRRRAAPRPGHDRRCPDAAQRPICSLDFQPRKNHVAGRKPRSEPLQYVGFARSG